MTLNVDVDQLKKWAADPAAFALEFFPAHIQPPIPDFHHRLYELALSPHPRKCVICPRGFGKSSTMSFVYILHSILFQTHKFIVLVSDSLHQSKLFLEAIADELRFNEHLRSVFGDITTDQWSQESITTKTGIRVVAKGSGQKLRGLKYGPHRPTLMVFDDCENDEQVSTPEQRLKLRRWFYGAALPALAPEGQVFIVGTILHQDSLLNHIYEHDPSFEKAKFAAISEDGRSLWPERWPLDKLERERRVLTDQGLADVFSQEYLCEAIDAATAEFKPSEFAYYDPANLSVSPPQCTIRSEKRTLPLNVTMAVDPSMGRTARSDFSAIVTVGVSPTNHVYLLDVFRRRCSPAELIDALFERVLTYSPIRVRIEANGFQTLLSDALRDEQRRRNVHFVVDPYRSTRNKETRIRGLIPRVSNQTLVFPKPSRGDSDALIEELALFPRARHDDAADALAAALEGAVAPALSRRSRQRRHYTPVSAYGGY